MSELRTDFKDDVLDVTQNEKRKYRVIHNEDGTISLEDATAYLQQGDSFGANDLNEMNRMANQMNEAAGEILTMADDIDTLQDDVETLEENMTTVQRDVITLQSNAMPLLDKAHLCDFPSFSDLPYEFEAGSAVVLNGEIHILGSVQSSYTKAHYKWNGTSWTSVSTLPYDFYAGSAVVLNNEIHILGTSSSSANKAHYKWDGTSWTSVSTLPYKFYAGSAVALNNEIHILGTAGDGSYTKAHYKWNGTSWTSVSTLPYNFYRGSAVVLNNEIHILGSESDSTASQKHYKWNGTKWTSVGTLPYNFYRGSAVVIDDDIYILGSAYYYNSAYTYATYIQRFKKTAWSGGIGQSLKKVFFDGCAVALNGEIYILGCGNSSANKQFYKNRYGKYITGYACENTKLYIPYNQYFYTSNLETNGDVITVTETGYINFKYID